MADCLCQAGTKGRKEACLEWPKQKAEELLRLIAADPYRNPPSFEKLVGDLDGAYSRRLNIQHRLVYEIFVEEKTVRILRMWTHYE